MRERDLCIYAETVGIGVNIFPSIIYHILFKEEEDFGY